MPEVSLIIAAFCTIPCSHDASPGETLRALIMSGEIDGDEFGKMSGLSPAETFGIIRGAIPITPDIADRLMFGTGIDASFWLESRNQPIK